MKSSNSLIKEIDIVRRHIDFKDQTIRNIDISNNLNLHIKLPSKISYEGELPPQLEAINSNVIGDSRFPTSWKIVQSIPTNLLENIRQRIIDEGEPKYLNSPETPFFNKSNELFGLHEVKEREKNIASLIVVEG